MPEYRRLYHPGGSYFFTVNLLDRRRKLLTENFDLLLSCLRSVQDTHPFHMRSYVVLPDHLHCIWTLPDDDGDFSVRWKMIKARFSRAIPKETDTQIGRRKGERGIWQRRFWEHLIRDDEDLHNHLEYIRYNPVKHGYAEHPDDWTFAHWHTPFL